MYICVCICVYMCVCRCVCIGVCGMYMGVCVCVSVCLCVGVCMCRGVCVDVCMCRGMCIDVCVYVRCSSSGHCPLLQFLILLNHQSSSLNVQNIQLLASLQKPARVPPKGRLHSLSPLQMTPIPNQSHRAVHSFCEQHFLTPIVTTFRPETESKLWNWQLLYVLHSRSTCASSTRSVLGAV